MRSKRSLLLLVMAIGFIVLSGIRIVDQSRKYDLDRRIGLILEHERKELAAADVDGAEDSGEVVKPVPVWIGKEVEIGPAAAFLSDTDWMSLVERLDDHSRKYSLWMDVSERNFGVRRIRDWKDDDLEYMFDAYRDTGRYAEDLEGAIAMGVEREDFANENERKRLATFLLSWQAYRWSELLYSKAIVSGELGLRDEAFEALTAGFRLADLIVSLNDHDGRALHWRHQIYGLMLDGLQEAFAPGDLTSAQSRFLFDVLSGEDTRKSHLAGWKKSDTAWLKQFRYEMNYKGTGLASMIDRAMQLDLRGTFQLGSKWMYSKTVGNIKKQELAQYRIEFVGFMQEHSSVPLYKFRALAGESLSSAYTYNSLYRRVAELEARIDLARLGVMIELYWKQRGEWLESLGVAADHYDVEFPIDPFSGRDYGYRVEGDEFMLWSAAPDGVDAPEAHRRPIRRGGSYRGNLVWRGENYYEGRHERGVSDARFVELLEAVR